MHFKQIVDEIGDSLNDTCSKWAGENASRVKEAVNEFLALDFLTLLDWDFLSKSGLLTTIDEYTTGTVSVTRGSATVTGSGTTFTSAMVGRRILVSGSTKSYKITGYSSATSTTLESAFESDSISGATYSIAKSTINLPRWVASAKQIQSIVDRLNNKTLTQLSRQEADRQYGAMNIVGVPKFYTPSERVRTLYTTGTIAGTSATYTLSGTSTNWLTSGLEQFDVITDSTNSYTIKSVDSDTAITTYESLETTISASTAYIATQDRWAVELYPIPKYLYSYQINALRIHPKLVNSTDIPEIPDNWHYLLVKGGRVKMLKHNQDPNYLAEAKELTEVLKRLVSANNRELDKIERFSI